MATDIYIGTQRADCEDDVTIVFSGGDIRNITEGRVNSSYEITLPLTATNKKLLQYSDDLNCFEEVTDQGYVFINGLQILRGKVIVLTYERDKSASILIQGTGWVDHFQDLSLRSLDLSAENYEFTAANVEASWSGAAKFYRYPMIFFAKLFSGEMTTTANWLPNDFIPMFRVVDILTKIFEPFTLAGGWLTEAAEVYVLGHEVIARDEFLDNKGLDVKVNSTSDNTDSDTLLHDDTADVNFEINPVILNNEITDEGNDFSLVTHYYQVPEDGTYNFKLFLQTNWTATDKAQLTRNNSLITISLYKTDGITPVYLGQKQWSDYTGADFFNLGEFTFENSFVHFNAGDYVYFRVTAQMNLTDTSGSNQTVTLFFTTATELTLVWDRRNLYPGIGKTIIVADMLPDTGRIDFVKALKEAYNLRFTPDLINQTVYVESFDKVMSTNVRLLEKIDHSTLPSENVSSNYSSLIKLKLKTDTSDKAVTGYLLRNDEPYVKEIILGSVYTKKGVDTWENSLFAYTQNGDMYFASPTITCLRIFTDEEYPVYQYFPDYRIKKFAPRLLNWDGVTSGITWYFNGSVKTQYPKATTVDMTAVYTTNFLKTFHLIDKGKILRLEMVADKLMMQQFITVVSDINSEGFRAMYEIVLGGQSYYGYLNKIEFQGNRALMELIIKK